MCNIPVNKIEDKILGPERQLFPASAAVFFIFLNDTANFYDIWFIRFFRLE